MLISRQMKKPKLHPMFSLENWWVRIEPWMTYHSNSIGSLGKPSCPPIYRKTDEGKHEQVVFWDIDIGSSQIYKRMQIICALLTLPWKHPCHLIPLECQGRVPDAQTPSLTSQLNTWWGDEPPPSTNRKGAVSRHYPTQHLRRRTRLWTPVLSDTFLVVRT